jgi:hypothetical protein
MDTDYDTLAAAYQATVMGKHLPACIIATGACLNRWGKTDRYEDDKVYSVTRMTITEITDAGPAIFN